MWKILPPHIWGAFIVFAWGVIATCQAAVQTYQGELALRFILGIFEAGFGPGVPYLLSFFYLRHEVGSRIGLFLSAAPLANTFASALAYGITSGNSSLANWRLLFLVEGIPTLIMAVVTFFCLPDSPSQAKFLTEEEKLVAEARGVKQVGEVERVKGLSGVNFKEIGSALLDLKCWLTALMYFSCNVSFSSLPVFLPTILEEMGFSSVNAQGLAAPPYFISFLVTIGSSILADRLQQRGLMIMFLASIGGIGYVILTACETVAARYVGVFLAAAGIFPTIANILPWVTSKFSYFIHVCSSQLTSSRQPRFRHPSRHRYRPAQHHWPVRSSPRNEHFPGFRCASLHQGHGHLYCLHVLRGIPRFLPENVACLGEQEAREGVCR